MLTYVAKIVATLVMLKPIKSMLLQYQKADYIKAWYVALGL